MSVAEPEIIPRRDSYRFGNGPSLSLRPGTFGWSINDLRDPEIRQLWEAGRFEILDGVLIVMPPAYFRGGSVVDNLKFILRAHFRANHVPAAFSGEVDIAIASDRVVRADGVAICGNDLRKFDSLHFAPPRTNWRDHELTLPPTIIIESVSRGHETHDHITKRNWYAQFKVPNYWIVDGLSRSLDCLRLSEDHYVTDTTGKDRDILKPAAFPGLAISLQDIWEDAD
jgi:Uma2 family endonuclease